MSESWIREQIEGWVADFLEERPTGAIPREVLPVAEPLLVAFLEQAHRAAGRPPGELEESDVRAGLLEGAARLDLDARRAALVPRLVGDFLEDLERRGRLADGADLGRYAAALREAFAHAVAPAPIQRPASKVGRNDPCPCGSGHKYKKCCMRALD